MNEYPTNEFHSCTTFIVTQRPLVHQCLTSLYLWTYHKIAHVLNHNLTKFHKKIISINNVFPCSCVTSPFPLHVHPDSTQTPLRLHSDSTQTPLRLHSVSTQSPLNLDVQSELNIQVLWDPPSLTADSHSTSPLTPH